jgi:hypothetical protein
LTSLDLEPTCSNLLALERVFNVLKEWDTRHGAMPTLSPCQDFTQRRERELHDAMDTSFDGRG